MADGGKPHAVRLFAFSRASLLLGAACLLLAACTPKFDWREVRSADGGFTLLLPDKPQTVTREIAFGGGTIRMTLISTGVGPTLFAAGFAQLPPDAVAPAHIDDTIGWFRDALVRNVDGRVTSERPTRLAAAQAAGHVVRGGQIVEAHGRVGRDRQPGRLAAHFHVVDDRIYEVVAIGADGELTADALETFFTSFRLVN
jgi:hypothetical protein